MLAVLRQRDFGLLWLAGLISIAGDLALVIALPLHVYQLTDSTLATAGAFAASFLPGVVIGSVAGVFVDRWDRKRTMVMCDLSRAVLLLPLLIAPDHLAVLYGVAAVQGTIGLFFRPAESALLPLLVGEDRLVTANALNSLNDNFGMLIGPALGSFLYAAYGISGAAIFDAVSYVGSALLIRLIVAGGRPVIEASVQTPETHTLWRRLAVDWRDGIRVIHRDRALVVLASSSVFLGISEGVFLTLGLSPLVLDVLGGTPAQVGWLATAQAVGGLMAGIVIARRGHRIARRWLIGGGMIGIGTTDFSTFNTRRLVGPGLPAVGVAMGWMVIAGFPSVAGGTGRQSLVQERVVDAFRGRVFGALGAVLGVSMLIGFGIGGVLGDSIGLVPVLSASALVRILGGLIVLRFMPGTGAFPARDATRSDEFGLEPGVD
jgi:MFS family permease